MLSNFAIITTLLAFASADFQIQCHKAVARAFQDPVVSPGEKSMHAHDLYGAAGDLLNVNSTDVLTNAPCTTCNVDGDRSVYWVPSMYMTTGGQKKRVDAMFGVYYRTNDNLPEEVDFASMNGLRLLVKPKPGEDRSNPAYRCWTETTEGPVINTWPTGGAMCKSLLSVISAGDCWNGELDSEDHMSHVTWSDPITMQCPPGFRRIPRLQLNSAYNFVSPIMFNGDNTQVEYADGSKSEGYHGDFILAWNIDEIKTIAQKCQAFEPEEDCIGKKGITGLTPIIMPAQAQQCEAQVQFPSDQMVPLNGETAGQHLGGQEDGGHGNGGHGNGGHGNGGHGNGGQGSGGHGSGGHMH